MGVESRKRALEYTSIVPHNPSRSAHYMTVSLATQV